MMQMYTFAVMIAIGFLMLLSSKESLNSLKEKFSREELGNSLKFAVISLVVLPLLPDQRFSIVEMISHLT